MKENAKALRKRSTLEVEAASIHGFVPKTDKARRTESEKPKLQDVFNLSDQANIRRPVDGGVDFKDLMKLSERLFNEDEAKPLIRVERDVGSVCSQMSKLKRREKHETFMSEFWSMYYHYPPSSKPVAGGGIYVPAPSSRDTKLSVEVIRARKERIKELSKPKKREDGEEVGNEYLSLMSDNAEPKRRSMKKSTESDENEKLDYISQKLHEPDTPTSNLKAMTKPSLRPESSKGLPVLEQPESLEIDLEHHKAELGSAGRRAIRMVELNKHNSENRTDTISKSQVDFFQDAQQSKAEAGIPYFVHELEPLKVLTRDEDVYIHSTKRVQPEDEEESNAVHLYRRSVVRPSKEMNDVVQRQIGRRAVEFKTSDIIAQSVKDGMENDKSKDLNLPKGSRRKSSAVQSSKQGCEKDGEDLLENAPVVLRKSFDKVVEIFGKMPSDRTMEELELIQNCLRPISAFHNITSNFMFTQICTHLYLVQHPKDHIIFKQGDLGDAWYIILSGKINILVSKGFDRSTKILASVLGCGEAFGNHSLVHDEPRTATVVCATDCMLLRMERGEYKRLLGFVCLTEQKELMHFVRLRVPLFARLDEVQLGMVCERMSVRKFKCGTVILREGEARDHVFILERGVCAVFRNVDLKDPKTSIKTSKQVFIGNLNPGAYFNEQSALQPKIYIGSPFTVVALKSEKDEDMVDCVTLNSAGDWTRMELDWTPSKFAEMSTKEILRIQAAEERKRIVGKVQKQMLLELAKEKTKDPLATIEQYLR
ncbi:Cyclic nucleotide-binding domain-containing protein 2, partial [Chytridiales sp. JEL 0842]